MQQDLFYSDEYQYLSDSLEKYKTSSDSVRRGLFHKMSDMDKRYCGEIASLKEELLEMKLLLERLFEHESMYIPQSDFSEKILRYE